MKPQRLASLVIGTMLSLNLLAAETNLSPPISGTVRDTNGAPAVGLDVLIHPQYVEAGTTFTIARTDSNGHFRFESYLNRDPTRLLMVRDPARNLAAVRNMEEGTTVCDLDLAPAVVISGRVQDQNGNPVTNAQLKLFIWEANHGYEITDNQLKINSHGRYEVSALPVGRPYSVYAFAEGYGIFFSKTHEPNTPWFEFEAIVLKTADKKIAGVVLDAESKPAAGITVFAASNTFGVTDEKGEFVINGVYEGTWTLQTSTQKSPPFWTLRGSQGASTRAAAGDTNVVIVLGPPGTAVQTNRRPLVGKPLPDLTATGIPSDILQTNKPLLICLFDPEQRSSRRMVKLLGDQDDALKQQGISVIGISAALTTPEALKQWKQSNPIPFPIGAVTEKNDKTKWIISTDKLPWLILTDPQGRIKAEGFDLDELDAKLK